MNPRGWIAIAALGGVAFIARPALAQEFPKFTAPVVDAADVVPDDVEERLNVILEDFQDRMDSQIAVAVVKTTGNQSIEDYTIDLAREWGVGRAGEDDGVVFLIAFDDRRLRIEVGPGVQDELTDLETGRIIREQVEPRMEQGDVGGAIEAGVTGIRVGLGDEEAPPLPAPIEDDERSQQPDFGFLAPLLILGAFGLFGRSRLMRRRFGMTPIFWGGGWGAGSGSGGGLGGGGGGFGGGGGGGFNGGGASGGW